MENKYSWPDQSLAMAYSMQDQYNFVLKPVPKRRQRPNFNGIGKDSEWKQLNSTKCDKTKCSCCINTH